MRHIDESNFIHAVPTVAWCRTWWMAEFCNDLRKLNGIQSKLYGLFIRKTQLSNLRRVIGFDAEGISLLLVLDTISNWDIANLPNLAMRSIESAFKPKWFDRNHHRWWTAVNENQWKFVNLYNFMINSNLILAHTHLPEYEWTWMIFKCWQSLV